MACNKSVSYHERLTELGLTTLQTRRLCHDFIEVFKNLEGFVSVGYMK